MINELWKEYIKKTNERFELFIKKITEEISKWTEEEKKYYMKMEVHNKLSNDNIKEKVLRLWLEDKLYWPLKNQYEDTFYCNEDMISLSECTIKNDIMKRHRIFIDKYEKEYI